MKSASADPLELSVRGVVPLLALCALGTLGCDGEDRRWDGRCSANGGTYSITVGAGTGETFTGTWGECWYSPTVGGDDNAIVTLFDSRVTPTVDEEANTYSVSYPDGYRGIADLAIGLTTVGEPGTVPVESNPFSDWNEFDDTSFDHDLAMAVTGFIDDLGYYWIASAAGGGTVVIDEVDWPGWKGTGELVLRTGDAMEFPTSSYTARVDMDADLTLVVVPAEEESGSMLNGIKELP